MEKKSGLGICIIIVLMLIMTSFVSAINLNPLEKKNQLVFSPLNPLGDLCTIDLTKYVKNDTIWSKTTTVKVGDTVKFKIIVNNTGNTIITSYIIKDNLPAFLTYNNDANITPASSSPHHIQWNLTNLSIGKTTEIMFTTHADTTGEGVNYANVTTHEGPYDNDTARVIVKEIPHLRCEKKVWDTVTKQWVQQINAHIGETVRFKINISYWGPSIFYSIWVNDTLPTGLKYTDNATPFEPVINGKKLTWFLDTFLQFGQNRSIVFTALVISDGINKNIVNITGKECGKDRIFYEANATVQVEKAPEPLIAEAGGPYTGYVGEPIQITGSATGGIPDYIYKWDLNNDGIYDDANGKTISHSWTTQGTKTIYLKVTDSMDKNDTDSATVTVNIRNQPPNTPSTPEGKATIKINKENTYTTLTTDPNGDQIWYWIDWGDETNSGWVGPFASGATATATHMWTKRGTYQIKVKAKDSSNVESAYSNSFEVKVKFLVSQSFQIPTILQKLIERFPMLERFFYHYFSFSF